MQTVNPEDVDEGSTVTIEYTPESRLLGRGGRKTMEDCEVLEQMGQIVKVANPFEDDELTLIIDPDGDLWAREGNDASTDGLFGSNARVVA